MIERERVRLLFAQAMNGNADVPPGTVVTLDRSGLVVACGVGRVRVTHLSLSRGSGKPMDIASLLNGYPDLIRPGQMLGSPP
jgi:methionyl-tRNA formyltransferase